MTDMTAAQINAEKVAQAVGRQLTERQIDAACTMWRDPEKWQLVPTPVGKRNLYVRQPPK
jgi:hypothetical protein